MQFCLSSRLPMHILRKADEIKVEYRDRKSIPDLIEKYPGKTIILFPTDEDYDWSEISMYSLMCGGNFILNVRSMAQAYGAKAHEIKFMIDTEITSYWDLEGLEAFGVEYAYVGIPLFFDLKNTLNFKTKLRTIPTVAYNHTLPHENGVCGQWIRPEDLYLYEDYIQVIEFEKCLPDREKTLFEIYAEKQKWSTRLDVLVEDLGSNAVNRMIPPELGEARISCQQKCTRGASCHLCHTMLTLADPELLAAYKERHFDI